MGFKRTYRKTFGHKSPYRRVFGSRNAGQAIGASYRTARGVAQDIAKLKKDMTAIKSRQNNEKKHKDADVATSAIGQVNANADGYVWYDVTPDITQGIDGDERIGNSLKLTGLTFPLQFSQQVSCFGGRKVRVSLLRVTSADNGVSGDEAIADYWDTNPLTTVRDYNAPKAYRNQKTDGIKCVRTMTVYVPAPKLRNDDSQVSDIELSSKSVRMSIKLNDIFRYNASSDTKPDGIRYYIVIQMDSGNRSGSNSTLDVPVTTNSSGLTMRLAQRSWWIDN